MSLSVTCQCGARLEIDEKFLGKEIPCPDCQRPLPTSPPATPPPLDLPNTRRLSGLAILSLTLALVGAFTLIGTLAAIGVGVLALREIARWPNKLEGVNFARAGIALGGFFTLLTAAALLSPTVFGLDVFLRELALVQYVKYANTEEIFKTDYSQGDNVEIKRDSLSDAWGKYTPPTSQKTQQVNNDLMILVNIGADAYISCLSVPLQMEEGDEREKKILEQFYKSELVNLLGRLRGRPLGTTGTVSERKAVGGDNKKFEITVDLRLGRLERRFLIQYTVDINKSNVLIGAARRNRFDRLQGDFHKAFESAVFK